MRDFDSATDSPTEPRLGAVLDGGYQLTRVLSQGGMGTVFEAVQLRLQRKVAVKIMAGDLSDHPEALARFRREVKVTSKLAHPHVIQLFDFGTTEGGRPYLVMEYLEGEDLEQRIDRVGRLGLGAAVGILKQIGAALAAVHGRGIVHRDLKPANVLLLDVDGVADFVKVIDFGISKIATSDTQLTGPSSVLGTPDYMSPEQASGRAADVDHRSDQWALGCIAWCMLTGRPPFAGRDMNDVLDRIVRDDPPPLAAVAPELPATVATKLEPVLRRALAKPPSQRFPTVVAFTRALENAVAGAAS